MDFENAKIPLSGGRFPQVVFLELKFRILLPIDSQDPEPCFSGQPTL
jgi:hypothetical protein